jgi:hypothetical protein
MILGVFSATDFTLGRAVEAWIEPGQSHGGGLLSFRLTGFDKTRKVVLVVLVVIRSLALLLLLASSLLGVCFLFLGETCLDLVGSFLLLGGLGSLVWFVFFG